MQGRFSRIFSQESGGVAVAPCAGIKVVLVVEGIGLVNFCQVNPNAKSR